VRFSFKENFAELNLAVDGEFGLGLFKGVLGELEFYFRKISCINKIFGLSSF